MRGGWTCAPDASWAAAVAFCSLIHLPRDEVAAALRELHRVLRPGGPRRVRLLTESPQVPCAEVRAEWPTATAGRGRRCVVHPIRIVRR